METKYKFNEDEMLLVNAGLKELTKKLTLSDLSEESLVERCKMILDINTLKNKIRAIEDAPCACESCVEENKLKDKIKNDIKHAVFNILTNNMNPEKEELSEEDFDRMEDEMRERDDRVNAKEDAKNESYLIKEPVHFNCRCAIEPITESSVNNKGSIMTAKKKATKKVAKKATKKVTKKVVAKKATKKVAKKATKKAAKKVVAKKAPTKKAEVVY